MTTQFNLNAQFLPRTHLKDQVDIFLNLADDSVESNFDSDFDDLAPEVFRESHARSTSASRRPAKPRRGLAEVAAEVSSLPN